MGCAASRFEREKSVTGRCRNREQFIKRCVQNQHTFAAAHASYIRSLRDVGAALRQFGEGGEAKPDTVLYGYGFDLPVDRATDDSKQLAHTFGTPYFPPPLPHFLTPSFLSRTCTIPQFNFSSPHALSVAKTLVFSSPRNSFTLSREESVEADAGARKSYYVKPPPPLPAQLVTPPAPPLSKGSQWEFYDVFQLTDRKAPAFLLGEEAGVEAENANVKVNVEELKTPPASKKASKLVLPSNESCEVASPGRPDHQMSAVEFSCTLKQLDDNFLQAYESGRDVARLLEGQRTHYYSSLDGINGSFDHSSRVLRVMSWGRHTQFASATTESAICGDEKETHASTLDKLLAWEKKLYDEVKVGEVIRVKLERKSVQLKKQKKREESSVTMSKTKAVVKSLQTRYLVEVEAVDAASSEVQKLRDDCLHVQLVDLVQKLMTMWQAMLNCHQQQYQLIEDMQLVDSTCIPSSTNDTHIRNTLQLESEINIWHRNLENLILTQKDYMNSVYLWLHLHVTEIESGGKGASISPERLHTPPVYALCKSWLLALDQIHGNVPLHALKAFSHVIQELKMQQAAELKQKKKLQQLKKELERKEETFKSQELKYKKFYMAHGSIDQKEEPAQERDTDRNPLKEKEVSLRLMREKVEMEREKYEQMCAKSGNMTLTSLQKGLPPVLNALKEFARTCSQTYTELVLLTNAEEASLLQISY